MPTFFSVTEAAQDRGISRQAVLAMIKRGRIDAFKIGRAWAIWRGSWENYWRSRDAWLARKEKSNE